MVYSTRRFVVCLSMCHFVLVFFSPFSIAITSLGEERANLSAFRTFVRFVLVWISRFPLPLDVWEGLWFVIVALPRLFSYFFLYSLEPMTCICTITLIVHLFDICQIPKVKMKQNKLTGWLLFDKTRILWGVSHLYSNQTTVKLCWQSCNYTLHTNISAS